MPFIDPGELAGLKNATRAGHSAVLQKLDVVRRFTIFGAIAFLLGRMAFKKEFIESLTLSSGALLIAFFSVFVAWIFSPLPKVTQWVLSLAVPCFLAYCLFRAPTWLGAYPLLYDPSSLLTLLVWAVAGLAASAATIFLTAKLGVPKSDAT